MCILIRVQAVTNKHELIPGHKGRDSNLHFNDALFLFLHFFPEFTQPFLVTTGMDGVFPMGLKIAEVTRVYPLREGAYSYEIDAVPFVKNLDSLQTVFIIPKVGFDENLDESY